MSFYNKIQSSLIGMDGGNIHASVWFCGIEWGTDEEKVIDYTTRDTYTENGLEIPYLSSQWKQNHPRLLNWQFDQKLAKIMCEVTQETNGYKEYLKTKYCDKNGNEFKLNLFPLPARNVEEWTQDHIKITGDCIKYHYYTHCAETRFKAFNKMINVYQPKVVVCFGSKFSEEYKLAFLNDQQKYTQTSHKISNGNDIELIKAEGSPVILVCPFPGRKLNSDSDLKALGQIIRSHNK